MPLLNRQQKHGFAVDFGEGCLIIVQALTLLGTLNAIGIMY